MRKLLLTMLFGIMVIVQSNAKTIYVDAGNTAAPVKDGTTWAKAFVSLQAALDNAISGDEIRVAKGTYYPETQFQPDDNTSSDRQKTFALVSGVTVLGGYDSITELRDFEANETILSGDLGTPNINTDNAYQVVMVKSGTTNVVLDGFTIRDGYANGGSNDRKIGSDNHPLFYGGGIFLLNASGEFKNLKIINNAVRTATTTNYAGGFYCNAGTNSVKIYNTQFLNNATSTSNNASQYGGAIYTSGNITIDRCLFIGNSAATSAGALYLPNVGESSNVVVTNSIFYNNTSALGGAIHSKAVTGKTQTITLINSTFYGNTASGGGGAIHVNSSSTITVNFYNSISLGNTGTSATNDFTIGANSKINIKNSIIQAIPVAGVVTLANQVVNPAPADVFATTNNSNADFLKLKEAFTNPAVNSGDNDLIPVGITKDYTGVADRRYNNDIVDMGAYELQITVLPITLSSFTAKATNQGIQLNWSTASEKDNSHFQVWRKAGNNATFEAIGNKIQGAGNSSTTQKYQFVDTKPVVGANYYKLQQVDNNGADSYGKEVVAYAGLANAGAAINYAGGKLNLVFEAKNSGSASVAVFDVNGRKVLANDLAVVAGANQVATALSLAKGVYVVKLALDGSTATQKIVVY